MLEPCKQAPRPGTPVGVLAHRRGHHWVTRRVRVKAIIDHKPVDGAPTSGAIALLDDGTWEFYWNLTELPPCS